MAVIKKSRSHSLDFAKAKSSAEEIVVHLAEQFGVKYHWEGETVKFKGAGAKGYMTVLEDRFELKMELGFMLLPFRSRIEQEMDKYLDQYAS